jgi:hypothetical protein
VLQMRRPCCRSTCRATGAPAMLQDHLPCCKEHLLCCRSTCPMQLQPQVHLPGAIAAAGAPSERTLLEQNRLPGADINRWCGPLCATPSNKSSSVLSILSIPGMVFFAPGCHVRGAPPSPHLPHSLQCIRYVHIHIQRACPSGDIRL